MLEKANELDSIRQEMEKEYYKNLNLSKQKKILKRTSVNRPKELRPDLFKSIDRNESYRSKQNQSSIDLDTKIDIRDIENTDPNIEQKFEDSSVNVIFQSPVMKEDNQRRAKLKDPRIESKAFKLKNPDNYQLKKTVQRSFSKGGSRSSQVMNPLTDSYDLQMNNLERYASVGNFNKKPKIKKKKIRNSFRYMTSSNSNRGGKNLKDSSINRVLTEVNSESQIGKIPYDDHQKSTKMLIDCLVKQLNPITAYISNPNSSKNKDIEESERSRNDEGSIFLDIQEKRKGSHNYNHLTCTSNVRTQSRQYINFNT